MFLYSFLSILLLMCILCCVFCSPKPTALFPIYLISLDKDTNRRQNVLKYAVPTLVFAKDGTDIDIDDLKKRGFVTQNCSLTKGEIGCYLSHVHMLSQIKDNNSPYAIILEDDVILFPNTQHTIAQTVPLFPDPWEIVFLGHNYHEPGSLPPQMRGMYTYTNISSVYGAHAYCVRSSSVTREKIRALFPIDKPFDIAIPKIFTSYVIDPKLVQLSELSEYSNTQNIGFNAHGL